MERRAVAPDPTPVEATDLTGKILHVYFEAENHELHPFCWCFPDVAWHNGSPIYIHRAGGTGKRRGFA